MIRHNFGYGQGIQTDSSLSGYGAISNQSWIAGYFNSQLIPTIFRENTCLRGHWINLEIDEEASRNINILELIPVWLACVLWGKT